MLETAALFQRHGVKNGGARRGSRHRRLTGA